MLPALFKARDPTYLTGSRWLPERCNPLVLSALDVIGWGPTPVLSRSSKNLLWSTVVRLYYYWAFLGTIWRVGIWHQKRARQRGNTIVELALILTPMMALFMAIVEL